MKDPTILALATITDLAWAKVFGDEPQGPESFVRGVVDVERHPDKYTKVGGVAITG